MWISPKKYAQHFSSNFLNLKMMSPKNFIIYFFCISKVYKNFKRIARKYCAIAASNIVYLSYYTISNMEIKQQFSEILTIIAVKGTI